MKEYSTYIFDLDGTLLNTLDDLRASVNYALRRQGMPERTLEEIRRFVGNGVKKLVYRAVPDGTDETLAEQTLAIFKEHYSMHSRDCTCPYPGVVELLQRLKARGKNTAVVSNKFYDATRELCRHFFGDLIDVAIGEREDIKRKPAPDTVFEALRQLGLKKEFSEISENSENSGYSDIVYIGDSEVDFATAKNAGLPCISVLWGFRDKEFLMAKGATCFVEKPEEILI